MNPTCPNKTKLELLLRGKLDPAESESLGDHLRQCAACAKALETIPASDSEQNATTDMRGDRQTGVADQLRADSQLLDCDINFLAPSEQPDEMGRLGGYRILEVMGVGGMGMVFRAEDPKLERLVALKVMKPTIAASKSAKDRFLREAKATAALEHHNIVQIYQVGEDRGVPYIAMQYLRGESLQKRLSRVKQLGQREVLRIGREVADGLQAAHERDLIHRDIKPDNIWLDQKTGSAKILDFGLARATADDAGLTQTGTVLGTPRYMAPEQAQGEPIDFRCDLFSLGSVLYHLAAGKPAFEGSNLTATLIAVAQANPQPIAKLAPALHPDFARLIMRLLAKDREQRPQSAADVVQAIVQIEKQLESAAAEPTSQHAIIAPTLEIPKVDRSLRDRNLSSHGVTRLHSRNPVVRRVALAISALAALIICGVIIITPTNKVVTNTKPELITNDGRTDNPVRPSPTPPTDPTTTPDKIVRPTTEPTTPSTPATDPDRAAAEWVLSRRAGIARIEISVSTSEKSVGPNDDLPDEQFDLLNVTLVDSDDIDDESLRRFIAPLKSLRYLWLERCQKISNESAATLKLLPNLFFLNISGTSITSDTTIELISIITLSSLQLDTNQFTDAVAATISQTPRLEIVGVHKMTDAQFRSLMRAQHLKVFNCIGADAIRASTWARLPDSLPSLSVLYPAQTNLDDAGLAAISRLTKLQNLNLDYCRRITDRGLILLTACADLKQLTLRSTAITPLGLADFLEAKPECAVVWDGVDHRAVAEWVLSVGGKVQVAGCGAEWFANVAITAPRDEPGTQTSAATPDSPMPTADPANAASPNNSLAIEPSAAPESGSQGSSRGAMTATLRGLLCSRASISPGCKRCKTPTSPASPTAPRSATCNSTPPASPEPASPTSSNSRDCNG